MITDDVPRMQRDIVRDPGTQGGGALQRWSGLGRAAGAGQVGRRGAGWQARGRLAGAGAAGQPRRGATTAERAAGDGAHPETDTPGRQPVSSGSSYQVTFSPTRARIFHLTDFGAASIACRSRSALDATACA